MTETATETLTATNTLSPTPTPYVAHGLYVPQQYASIQAAIDAAHDFDWVVVSPGTYHERIDFHGKAISVIGESTDATIIDGGGMGPVVTFQTHEGRDSVLGGFTIRNGSATDGAGIYVTEASPYLSALIVEGNHGCNGIGLYVAQGSPRIDGSTLRDNHQTTCPGGSGGGAIALVGTGEAEIFYNVIEDNSAATGGGGLALDGAGSPQIESNVIRGNEARRGGGISMVNRSDPAITQNIIVGNTAADGGGIYWLTPSQGRGPYMVNNTVYGNTATRGSAVFADGADGGALLVNNILVSTAAREALYCGRSSDPNPPLLRSNDIFSFAGPAYRGLCTNQTGLNGNISADPMLYDPASGDFHQTASSPTIDMGDNEAPGLPEIDFDRDPRILDGDFDPEGLAIVDNGADELVPDPTPLFTDGFESSDLSAWSSSQTDGGDLSVSSAAAIEGQFGLQAVIDDGHALYVEDDTPEGEMAYRTRFYFDPNGAVLAGGKDHVVFLARHQTGLVAFRIELRSHANGYEVRAVAPQGGGPAYVTPWIPLTDEPHSVEVGWWPATGPRDRNGRMEFLVDGQLVDRESHLRNHGRQVDSVRLGAVAGASAGTHGDYFFDAFASTTGFPIGP